LQSYDSASPKRQQPLGYDRQHSNNHDNRRNCHDLTVHQHDHHDGRNDDLGRGDFDNGDIRSDNIGHAVDRQRRFLWSIRHQFIRTVVDNTQRRGHPLQAGVRIYVWSGVLVTPSVTGLAYDDVSIQGLVAADGVNGAPATALPADQGKIRGEVILASNFDYGNGLSWFGQIAVDAVSSTTRLRPWSWRGSSDL
jgi:hypothetical protein